MSVLLVQMPFASVNQPSLALSLLKANCEGEGHKCEVYYPNLIFSKAIGHELYSNIASYYPQTDFLIGEAIFSEYINATNVQMFFDEIIRDNPDNSLLLREFFFQVHSIRTKIYEFIDHTAKEIERKGASVIGVTSIFQQHAAALAIAKAIRKNGGKQMLVLGGSNCEGEMGAETAASFADYDLVVSGPGENAFLEILNVVQGSRKVQSINGVYPTKRQPIWPAPAQPIAKETPLNDLPFPDFSDFFDALTSADLPEEVPIQIPFEGSRGCWWGVKNHCTFCGLNGESMRFREKSPNRVLSELHHMADSHRGAKIVPVDNIMPNSFFQHVLPELAKQPVGELFYEVKANLNIDQLTLLKNAGVSEIQPGIESLSDASLRRMRKGVSSLQNIKLLKDAKMLGITVYWNILFGFPGETLEEYIEQLEIMDAITHLMPPISSNMVRVDRFSPMFARPQDHGITSLTPSKAYSFIYSASAEKARVKLAYYFEATYPEADLFLDIRKELKLATSQWRHKYPTSYLAKLELKKETVLVDTRSGGEATYVLRPVDKALFEMASSIVGFDTVMSKLELDYGGTTAAEVVERWERRRCIIRKSGRLLSLVEDHVDASSLAAAVFLNREQVAENQMTVESV